MANFLSTFGTHSFKSENVCPAIVPQWGVHFQKHKICDPVVNWKLNAKEMLLVGEILTGDTHFPEEFQVLFGRASLLVFGKWFPQLCSPMCFTPETLISEMEDFFPHPLLTIMALLSSKNSKRWTCLPRLTRLQRQSIKQMLCWSLPVSTFDSVYSSLECDWRRYPSWLHRDV